MLRGRLVMKATCPKCKAVYNVDDSKMPSRIVTVKCNKCDAKFRIEKKLDDSHYKKCPFCAGTIMKRATICRHCGKNLPGASREHEVQKEKVPVPVPPAPEVRISGPRCPTCGSSYIEKISLKNKIGSGAVFGVFAIGHMAKTFKCKGCGYKW